MVFLLITLSMAILIQIALFIPAYLYKTDKLTDLSYGLTFVLLAILGYISSVKHFGSILLTWMISIWSFRLIFYLFKRASVVGKDSRFDGVRGNPRKFIKFWIGQGLTVWIVMLASLLYYSNSIKFSEISYIGLGVFTIGLLIESFADYQKFIFKLNEKNKGEFIQSGFWRYSRHPNYFGEFLVWIGVWLFVLPGLGLSKGIIGLISPIFILIVLLFVTGIPTLEKRYDKIYAKNREYQNYKKKTSKFILWLPKA